jgi:hypothetical protein
MSYNLSVAELLGIKDNDFKQVFVWRKGNVVVVGIEPYDMKLLEKFPNTEYVEINKYF